MTCRDFKHYAASLSLLQLAQREDPQIASHTRECANCDSWLQKQLTLNASLHALRTRTAGQEAGPDVERELLRVFRQGIPVSKLSSSSAEAAAIGVKGPMEMLYVYSKTAPRSTPFALRLSRVFEIGAYAAVAAAIVIAIFLGAHLLHHGSDSKAIQSKSAPEQAAPVIRHSSGIATASREEIASESSESAVPKRHEGRGARSSHSTLVSLRRSQRQATTASAGTAAVADYGQSYADAGYTALMLCDPLSCASDTQVVRMELPPAAGQGSQPSMADVVVGYDGVVRAVRFEN